MKSLSSLVESIELKRFAVLSEEDSRAILRIRNEPDVRENMYSNAIIELAEHQAWMRAIAGDESTRMFAVISAGEIVGAIGLRNFVPHHRRAEWAFYLCGATQGRGLGSALEFKFLSFVFSEFDLFKLNCEVLAFNTPVIAMHKKFGFLDEGLRRAHIWRDGQPLDTVLLGLTREEWLVKQQELRQRLFK